MCVKPSLTERRGKICKKAVGEDGGAGAEFAILLTQLVESLFRSLCQTLLSLPWQMVPAMVDRNWTLTLLLMELDKGLTHVKPGRQSEAVVRFLRTSRRFPFPGLIHSAFLSLSDVFRVGSNFLKLCVLKVTQQSEKHMEKILN